MSGEDSREIREDWEEMLTAEAGFLQEEKACWKAVDQMNLGRKS